MKSRSNPGLSTVLANPNVLFTGKVNMLIPDEDIALLDKVEFLMNEHPELMNLMLHDCPDLQKDFDRKDVLNKLFKFYQEFLGAPVKPGTRLGKPLSRTIAIIEQEIRRIKILEGMKDENEE